MKATIRILTARDSIFGTAHLQRMQTLQRLLSERNYHCQLIDLSDALECKAGSAIPGIKTDKFQQLLGFKYPELLDHNSLKFIIDLRDISISQMIESLRISTGQFFLLDNRHPARDMQQKDSRNPSQFLLNQVLYYDTIPHPQMALDEILDQLWLDPVFYESPDSTMLQNGPSISQKGSLLVYTGSLPPGQCGGLIEWIHSLFGMQLICSVIVCGRFSKEIAKCLDVDTQCFLRVEPGIFSRLLAQSELVLSYYGMTILEAWYLNRKAALYPIDSTEHDKLSRWFSKLSGMPYLKPENLSDPVQQIANLLQNQSFQYQTSPGANGQQKLLDQISDFFVDPD